jgi:hypothetical protein
MMILCRDFTATGSGRNIIEYWQRNPSAEGPAQLEIPPEP